jgi:hypothetical protein
MHIAWWIAYGHGLGAVWGFGRARVVLILLLQCRYHYRLLTYLLIGARTRKVASQDRQCLLLRPSWLYRCLQCSFVARSAS